MGWPSFPGHDSADFDDPEDWDDRGDVDDFFDLEEEDADADDQVIPPTAPLAQPGAFNLPYPRSPEQEERARRHARQWPYADDKPWDPDPNRDQEELRHHTAPWPLPQPPPIQEPEP